MKNTKDFYKYALKIHGGRYSFGGFDTLKEARQAARLEREDGSEIDIVRLNEYNGHILRVLKS